MTLETRAPLSTLDAACLCAERGLFVIPVWRADNGRCPCSRGDKCISPGKHPVIDAWQTSASTELTVLRDWFSADRHNLGVVCGASDVCVVDVDPRNKGQETFDALVAEIGPLPATLAADSGGGGQHFVFRRPAGDLVSKLGPGVDLLHGARQFLVEPSIHASGAQYRWKPGQAPDEIKIAALPEAWVKRARRAAMAPRTWSAPTVTTDARMRRASAYLARCAPAVEGDSGHTVTFNAVAHVMIGFDLDAASAYQLIATEYNPRCDPPWSERELKHKIDSVAKTCERPRGYLLDAERRPMHTTEQAAHQAPAANDDSGDWAQSLIATDKGKTKRGIHNTITFVKLFPDYRGKWSLDTMSGTVWFDGQPMRDTFVHDVRQKADQRLGFTPGVDDVGAAIMMCAEQRPFHPIQNYLHSIDWDGEPRLSAMASDYFGSTSALHAELVRKWMISAVARAMRPGCKVDTALMLFGEQGYFKSSFFAILGGAWHADSPIDISNKDSFQQIHAAWLYEFAELENVVHGRAESRLKAWLTSTHDMFRAPYARQVAKKARSCVICGTTNRKQFLTDDTGSRRFWIVPVSTPVDRTLLAEMRDQLWAEAVCAYEAGEPWWLGRESDVEREEANEDFGDQDAWIEPISSWLSPAIKEITMSDLLAGALKIEPARQDNVAQRRVARLMNALGWHRRREPNPPRRWRYVRTEGAA